jgi:hypothetical protein
MSAPKTNRNIAAIGTLAGVGALIMAKAKIAAKPINAAGLIPGSPEVNTSVFADRSIQGLPSTMATMPKSKTQSNII